MALVLVTKQLEYNNPNEINELIKLNNSLIDLVRSNNYKEVELLLKYGVNVDFKDNKHGSTALMFAAQKGNIKMVELLLSYGADMYIENYKCNMVAFRFAVFNDHIETVELLLSYDTTCDITKYLDNALRVASIKGCIKMVELLLNKGANVNAVHKKEKTALYLAIEGQHTEIVKVLLKAGANVDSINEQGNTALIDATCNNFVEIVNLLLKSGANVNATTKDGNTALHLAIAKGHTKIVEKIMEFIPNIGIVNNCENTALHLAAIGNNTECVKLILSKKMKRHNECDKCIYDNIIELKNFKKKTALIYAIQQGNSNIIHLLIKAGAKVPSFWSHPCIYIKSLIYHTY